MAVHHPYTPVSDRDHFTLVFADFAFGSPGYTVALDCGVGNDLKHWEFSGTTFAAAKSSAIAFIDRQLRMHGRAFHVPGITVRRTM